MWTASKVALALGFVGAMAIGTTVPVKAQGISVNVPGIHVHIGRHRHYSNGGYYGGGYNGGGYATANGCPPYYTIQGGACRPYRGY
jgi:hypothetical protein